MVKHGCCGGASGTKVAAEPDADCLLRCQNSHLISDCTASTKCCTSFHCDRCDQPCVTRWKCDAGCDFDLCETCYDKHWEDVVDKARNRPSPFEAVQLLKAVPANSRPNIPKFADEANHQCSLGMDDLEPFGGLQGLLVETTCLAIKPPEACSSVLSCQVRDALLEKSSDKLKEAVDLGTKYSVAPSEANLIESLSLSHIVELDAEIKKRGMQVRPEEIGDNGTPIRGKGPLTWPAAVKVAMNEIACAELQRSTESDADAVIAKIAEVRASGADISTDLFATAWKVVVDFASQGDTNTMLDILGFVPPECRPSSFSMAAQTAINQKLEEVNGKSGDVFLQSFTDLLRVAGTLNAKEDGGAHEGPPPEVARCLSARVRDALLADDDSGVEALISLSNTYSVAPDEGFFMKGPHSTVDLPPISLVQAGKLCEIANRLGARSWMSFLPAMLESSASEELKAAIPGGVAAVGSKLIEIRDAKCDLSGQKFESAWQSVCEVALEDPANSYPLLKEVPATVRAKIADVFRSAAGAAVESETDVAQALNMCKEIGITASKSLAGRACDELCTTVQADDWESARGLLRLALAEVHVDLDAEQLISGVPRTIKYYCTLMACANEEAPERSSKLLNALGQALPEVAAAELDAVADESSAGDTVEAFLEAFKTLRTAGISLASLPNAPTRAAKFLEVAVHGSVDSADAQELAMQVLESESDVDTLLGGVPEDVRSRASDLLDALTGNAIWQCSPSGDSEVPEERWLDWPKEWVREAEKGFKKNAAACAKVPPDYSYRRCNIDVQIHQQSCDLHYDEGTKYAVDFMLFTCLVTEPKKRGRVIPLRRCNKDREVTDPRPDQKHPWYLKQVKDHDAKEGDWMTNDFFFSAFTEALKNAGVTIEKPAEYIFDFRFNEDFRNKTDDGRKLTRGGLEYRLPYGWKRFSVNVKGEYDDGDNAWLRSGDEGWAIAYHGTAEKNLPSILNSGFRVGPRQKFSSSCGAGVYCTPFVDVAAAYASAQSIQGHSVQIVLQLRVDPTKIKRVTTGTEFENKYWVINDPADMRAYGVLIREAK